MNDTQSMRWGRRALLRGVGPLLVTLAAMAAPAGAAAGDAWQSAPAAVVQAVTHVPQSVFDAVDLQPGVATPVILHAQKPLTFGGKPGIYYQGSEPCPYCAAQRWAFIIAMARFGTWSDLGINQSATNDIDPATQTFTFSHATYSSPYVTVRTREILSSDQLPNGNYATLQRPTAGETALFNRYTSATYFPANPGYFPFLDFGNRVVISQSSYNPDVLQGLTREQIAADLIDPTSPVTMDIVATANYLSAATCLIDGGRPATVCQSPGVHRSTHFVKRSYGFGVSSCSKAKNGQTVCGGAPSQG